MKEAENKKNQIKTWHVISLIVTLMISGHNIALNVLAMIILAFILITTINKDEFLIVYFVLIFFEQILIVPFVGGSFFRVYQILFFVRLLIDFNKNKHFKFEKLNLFSGFLFLLFSLSYINSNSELISMFLNVIIIIYIVLQNKNSEYYLYHKVFVYVGIFSVLSGFYGILFLPYLSYGDFNRYSSIVGDPNYSALLYTLGFFSLVGSQIISKYIKNSLLVILVLLILTTVSLTGFVGMIFLMSIYLWFTDSRKRFYNLMGLAAVITVFFSVNTFGLLDPFYSRIGTSGVSDLNLLSSGRVNLFTNHLSHWNSLPIKETLFGGNNIIAGTYRNHMINLYGNVSHSTVIDMLFMIGLLGFLTITTLFFMLIYKNFVMYKKTKNSIYLSLALTKITIMYYSLFISIFPFRYFYTFFLL